MSYYDNYCKDMPKSVLANHITDLTMALIRAKKRYDDQPNDKLKEQIKKLESALSEISD